MGSVLRGGARPPIGQLIGAYAGRAAGASGVLTLADALHRWTAAGDR